MKKAFIRIVTLAVAILYVALANAGKGKNPIDTLSQVQSTYTTAFSTPRIVLRKANVIYPELFEGHEAQSLTYVENFSATRKKYLTVLFNKSKDYFPVVKTIFDQYCIPQEFKVLMAIESGFNGNVVSPAGAVGYWQFMAAPAREYGLKVKMKIRNLNYKSTARKYRHRKHLARCRKYIYVDERKDLIKSTHAAAQYLSDRCRELNNDWLLAAASYNCGIGNVRKAIKKSGIECAGFWDVEKFLPKETRKYVMNFITLNVIFNNYENFENDNLCFRDLICSPAENEADIYCQEEMLTCMVDFKR